MDRITNNKRNRQDFWTTRLDQVVTGLCILLWAVVIYYAYTQAIARARFGILFLGIALIIYALQEIIVELHSGGKLSLVLLAASQFIIVLTTVYLFLNFQDLYTVRVGTAYRHEYFIAALFGITMLYMTWRSFGYSFLFIVLGGIFYGYFGPYFPGVAAHGGLSGTRLLQLLVLEIEGFYGFLTQLVAAWIALFLLYAGLLQGYGAFNLIFQIAIKSTKYVYSGVLQTAVVASSVIGSINGSQTANAGMTGSFTIPLMKRNGIKSQTAGGIEAVASTLGQVLPPVMGAGAFIMASLVSGVGYVDVVIAGLIPATILVLCVVIAVHYIAANQLVDSDDRPETPSDEFEFQNKERVDYLIDAIKFGVPFVVLIFTLGFLQWTVMTSALYTAVSMIVTGIALPVGHSIYTDRSFSAVSLETTAQLKETVGGFRQGALITAPVAIILAAVNGVVDILMATGVPGVIALTLVDLSGGALLLTLILAMSICVILGLGMPTTAAYTIVAILIAPTLVNQFLVADLAAHYFVFYGAVISGLTPPVAACAAVAAGIAKANFWKTCLEALKISAPMYILPFTFIFHPEIVSGEIGLTVLGSGFITLIGAVGIIHSIHYQFEYHGLVTNGIKLIIFTLGVLVMTYPGTLLRFALAGVLITVIVISGPRNKEVKRIKSTVANIR